MEGEISAQSRMYNGIVCLFLIKGWIDGFHAEIEAQNKVIEVQSQSHTVAYSEVIEQM
jgi:hypothetical protein